jgi:hypothetical protein
VRFAPAEVLDAELHRLGLGDHREVDELVQIAGQARDRHEQRVDLVLRVVLGVVIERRAAMAQLIGRDPAAQGLAVGRRQHAELADEAPHVLRVAREGEGPLGCHDARSTSSRKRFRMSDSVRFRTPWVN